MATSPTLGIPLLAASQAQPEITFNEALLRLQAVAVGTAKDWLTTPPTSPTAGDVYLLTDTPVGAWAGQANKLAIYYGGQWLFVPDVDSSGTDIPMGVQHEGMEVYVRSTSSPGGPFTLRWNGSAWGAI